MLITVALLFCSRIHVWQMTSWSYRGFLKKIRFCSSVRRVAWARRVGTGTWQIEITLRTAHCTADILVPHESTLHCEPKKTNDIFRS